ncbi:unnamed protein product [Lathyrus sativus]|nr:unnamed protein product [Lathyrus sativus]
MPLMRQPPPLLQQLLFDRTSHYSRKFQAKIRTYNAMFSLTLPGMKFDTTYSRGTVLQLCDYMVKLAIGLVPCFQKSVNLCNMLSYTYLTLIMRSKNRIQCFRDNKNIEKDIITNLKVMLDDKNVHAIVFRMARDVLKDNAFQDLKLKLISSRPGDSRVYNTPTVSEVAALIVGDVDIAELRDIIIHEHDGGLQRIDEFHPTYLGYQYPLIFAYGKDGYRDNILHKYQHKTIVTK